MVHTSIFCKTMTHEKFLLYSIGNALNGIEQISLNTETCLLAQSWILISLHFYLVVP